MKKLLATILSIILVISNVPMGAITASATAVEVVPEGYTAVRTVLDLYKVRYNLAGNYILMNDIDLTEATAVGGDFDYGGNGWNPIGSDDIYGKASAFTGIFDGNGYTIKGMRIADDAALPSGTGTLFLGLFANNAGTIKNLQVHGNITSSRDISIYAGGISSVNNGIIIGCSNKLEITISGSRTIYAGGIVALNYGIIEKCYNDANISCTDKTSTNEICVGGISGYGYGGSIIQNSYNIGDVLADKGSRKGSTDAGGIQGITRNGSSEKSSYVMRCYNLGMITAKAYSGYYGCYAITIIQIIKGSIKYAEVEDCYCLTGTAINCATATSLTHEQTLTSSAYSGFDFNGVWEQNSNAIYEYPQLTENLHDNRDLVSAEIHTLPNKTTFTKWEEFEVEGCTLKFTFTNADTEYVTVTKDMVSGYDLNEVGTQTLTIKANRRELTYDIIVLEKDFNPIYTALDLYKVRNDLTANYILMNDIDLTEATAVGGDFDYGGNGWNPIGSDDIYGKASAFTGVFDGNGYTIKGMRITGSAALPSGVSSYLYVGLFANNAGTIKNLHINGSINLGKNKYIYAGGIAAYNSGTIIGCSNDVEITTTGSDYLIYAGGITAYNVGTIKECYNKAPIIATATSSDYDDRYAGGISGYGADGCLIENCYNLGNITAKTIKLSSYYTYAGGIQGYSYGSSTSKAIIKNCYNIGTITATGYSTSNYKKSAITYIYSSNYAEVQNCHYLSGTGDNCTGATSLSAALLKEPSVLEGFDFENIWTMTGEPDFDYPELQCFALNGKLGIKGNVAYLSTVKPDLTKVNKVDDTFTYKWFVDGNLVADTETYTLKSTDVGKKLELTVTGTKKYNQGTLFSDEITVSKAIQTADPVVPTEVSLNDNKLEITTVSTQEYSIDNKNWQSDGIFSNLDPNKEYTVYTRILENDLYLLGESKAVLTLTTDCRPITGSVNIIGSTAFGDTLTADVSAVGPDSNTTYRYEWKRGDEVVGTNKTYTIVKEDIDKILILYVIGTEDYIGSLSSAPVTATKASVQVPSAPVVETKTNTTVKLVAKTGFEYSIDKTNWQDSSLFEGLSAATEYTFYQRVKETEIEFASKSSNGTKVTTLKNTIPAPAKPTTESVSNNSVTIQKISGYEYSMDGITWQTNNVFTGLLPNTEYTFCQRIAESETDYASATSGYITVVTLKNTVNKPNAPVVESATDSSVTLTAVSGYEYSKNGTTWQKSNVFTGLEPLETYTFYQRIAETETDYVSEKSDGTEFKVKFIGSKSSTPVLVEVTNDKIVVRSQEGYQYSIDGINWRRQGMFTGLSPNTKYYVYCRSLESDTHYAGEPSAALVVTTLKDTVTTPSAPKVQTISSNSITLVAINNGEYSKDGKTWQTSNVFSGLSPNTEYTFYQRKAETNTSYVSEKSDALKICTSKQSVAAPAAPTLSAKTATSVTLVKTSGYEYSKDGNTWQNSNVFNDLKPNTTYTFYQRLAETNTSYASETSAALTITTYKNTAGAASPVIAVSLTATSVTLAPYTGYEYSKDGTTWQTSNVFTGLTANTTYTFYQRIAETADTNASASSAACNVTTSVKSACSISPAAPIVAETTTSKVVLVTREGYEYSKNGTTWQTSNIFSGLSSNTSYTFYQRIAETGSELASAKSAGVTVKTFTSSSGTTAATNYDRLRSYISSYGTTGSNGNKNIVRSSTTSSGMTIYYSLENTSSGIEFVLLTSKNTSTKLVGQTEFVLTRSSTNISVYSSMLYYYSGSLADSVSGTKSMNRSTYSASTTYSFYQSGSIIEGSYFSENFNTTMELLCTYWDNYIYSNLGFGLKGLGFKSFSGKGSAACDPLASYHTGTTETRNAYRATCTTNGYTGDTYCKNCGEKKSSGSVITCTGHHTYSNSCDKTCNTCGEERVIEHQYSNICDTVCNICNATRAKIEHIFDNECDENCNGCSETRKVLHKYDNACDTTCNECGKTRTAPDHVYDNACDITCNECGMTRTVPDHVYDNACDAECNVCFGERTVPEHNFNADRVCTECGKVDYVLGDVDGSEEVTDADAEYLLMYTFFPEDYPINQDADFTGDGSITDADAEYLLMFTFFPEDYPLN